jgi:methylated-DNA-[protein]-cysteine S-methyltransferase
MRTATVDSPLGILALAGSPNGLAELRFSGPAPRRAETRLRPAELTDAAAQLDEYFAGERRRFELRLDLVGTPFQQAVWTALQAIPFGTTISYSAFARELGRDSRDYEQVRRVAAAIGRNPVPIVVPCHRVLAANGDLTGYVGGLQRKRALLDLEVAIAAGRTPEPAWALRQGTLV